MYGSKRVYYEIDGNDAYNSLKYRSIKETCYIGSRKEQQYIEENGCNKVGI